MGAQLQGSSFHNYKDSSQVACSVVPTLYKDDLTVNKRVLRVNVLHFHHLFGKTQRVR